MRERSLSLKENDIVQMRKAHKAWRRGTLERVCLKISGEMFGDTANMSDSSPSMSIVRAIAELRQIAQGIEISIIIGGGNIFRGARHGVGLNDQARADRIGMIATIVNALVLESLLQEQHIPSVVMSAMPADGICGPIDVTRGRSLLKDGAVVIFAAGLGAPFFTTDSAAAVRAIEMRSQALIKLTKVPGVYDKDPFQHQDAKFIPRLSYDEVIYRRLAVMDTVAVALCRDHGMPIVVCSLDRDPSNVARPGNNLSDFVTEGGVYTLIADGSSTDDSSTDGSSADGSSSDFVNR